MAFGDNNSKYDFSQFSLPDFQSQDSSNNLLSAGSFDPNKNNFAAFPDSTPAALPSNIGVGGGNNGGGFFGKDGFTFGDFGEGLKGIAGLYNAYLGNKGLGLAKDQFNFQKGAFNTNLANQAKLTNADLQTRQTSRNDRGVGIPLADYMAQFGVSGTVGQDSSYAAPQAPQDAPALPPGSTRGHAAQLEAFNTLAPASKEPLRP